MKRKLFKKLAAAAAAAVMTLTLAMPMGVSAQPSNTYPATGERGTLTITKYESASGAGEWDETDNPQSDPSEEEGKTPLGGVTFSIRKVGVISQEVYGDGADKKLGLLYQITDTDILNKLIEKSVNPDSGTDKYTSTKLDQALKTYRNELEPLVTKGTEDINYQSDTTRIEADGELKVGQAKFSELDQGLYLVAETAAPPEVTTKSVPFFVSIPSVVNDQNGNTKWEMDINAYPKNSTSTVNVDKKITDVGETGDINSDGSKAEATVGDIITYNVPVTAVVPADGLTEVKLVDTMSKGLTLVKAEGSEIDPALTTVEQDVTGVVQVYSGTDTSTGTPLTEGEQNDYTVKAQKDGNGQTILTVQFTQKEIEALNAGSDSAPKFLFVYKAKLNANAIIGKTGNENNVLFQYKYGNNPDPVTKGDKATVYTWGIDITKQGEDAKPLDGVIFELYKDSVADENRMTFIPDAAGNYRPGTGAGQTTDLTTNTSGKITVKGLEAGTYILKEKETKQGYVLLKDTITITITDTNNDGNATATIKNGNGTETNVTMTDDGTSQSALVPITVVNNKGFDLPETGAAGTAIFAIAGIALVAGAGALLLFRRKSHR